MTSFTINLTQEQFDAARGKLTQSGINVTGESGTLSHSGAMVEFNYTVPTLTISIVKKPFFIADSYVESQIRGWFA
jgi:hypothetical protein